MNPVTVFDELTYGHYSPPYAIENDFLAMNLHTQPNGLYYYRNFLGAIEEKEILAKNAQIIIHPVEPIFLDFKSAKHLMIEFDSRMEIEPDSINSIYLKFPVHIGVFVITGEQSDLIDIFSFVPAKFSLYGDPHIGTICRYFKSSVYHEKPQTDYVKEGILEVSITNSTDNWIEMNRIVFDCSRMTVNYTPEEVYSKANVKIFNHLIAETDFEDLPSNSSYDKSFQIYRQKRLMLSVTSTKFMMEAGL